MRDEVKKEFLIHPSSLIPHPFFFCLRLKGISPPVSPTWPPPICAGMEGWFDLGLDGSEAVCWLDLSANILLAALRRPRSAGVSSCFATRDLSGLPLNPVCCPRGFSG